MKFINIIAKTKDEIPDYLIHRDLGEKITDIQTICDEFGWTEEQYKNSRFLELGLNLWEVPWGVDEGWSTNRNQAGNHICSWRFKGPNTSATLADTEALQTWSIYEISDDRRRISALEYEVKMLRTILKSKLLIRDNIPAENIRRELETHDYDYLEDLLDAIYDLGQDDDN